MRTARWCYIIRQLYHPSRSREYEISSRLFARPLMEYIYVPEEY